MIQGLIPGRGKRFSAPKACLEWLRPIQPPVQWVQGVLYAEVKWAGCELAGCTRLVPRSRIGGAIPLFHPYAFMACKGTTIPLSLPLPAFTPGIRLTQELYTTFCMLCCYPSFI